MRILLLCGVLALSLGFTAINVRAVTPANTKSDYKSLPKPGEKVLIGAGHYFIYGFTKPPKLGTPIMKVEIFTSDGKRDTSFTVKGDADMPSMRGAHSTGSKEFSLSAKGVYLLPVWLSMPGAWEFRFTLLKKGNEQFRGAYLFSI
ncbi:hypothetical protein KI809_09985 [Geobacter pelophilus]|uniref:YtkA-like domain-containing protein n=1 Tax=Geoanaerobacter pelophilus TaxID=60036 RepID=A0AAW4L9U9_9BACT|nr:hypothetical protein [Geoanaerobacter pelophilus]MBT0664627.1 hypothetical protein [Geoanaerobacter pelophilus]